LGKLLTVEKAALEKYLEKGQTEGICVGFLILTILTKKRFLKPRRRRIEEDKDEEWRSANRTSSTIGI